MLEVPKEEVRATEQTDRPLLEPHCTGTCVQVGCSLASSPPVTRRSRGGSEMKFNFI